MSNIVKKKQEILNNYLEKLSKIFTLRLVILFGSFVRGDWKEYSDIDLLIVADELSEDVGENYVKLKEYNIEPIAYNPNCFLKEVERPNLILLDALQYGKVLKADEDFFRLTMNIFQRTKEKFKLRWEENKWVWY
ncbi:hypothetical protein HRbin06_00087 [archaeon HR06]|nr:hypothetical protein HRbin06_00087 [archaeon HR06]